MKKRFALYGGMLAAMTLIAFVMVLFAKHEPEKKTERTESKSVVSDILQPRPDDWFKGNPDADVVVIKYSDFQCPACRFYGAMDNLLSRDEELGQDVLFIFRHFPLRSFRHAQRAALYTEAAGLQGHFWNMHDLLYVNQQQWVRGETEEVFQQLAELLELDMDQLEKDLENPYLLERIESDYEDGSELGVNAVPYYFINGESVEIPNDLDKYRELLLSYL